MGSSQMTLSPSGFERYRKGTRREQFLAEMERAVPWAKLYAVIEPHYPKVEGVGRPTVGLEKMLRMYLVAQWFDLTDPGAEEALYDSPALCAFVGVDLGREPVPDETTLCKFRHLLEDHGLARSCLPPSIITYSSKG